MIKDFGGIQKFSNSMELTKHNKNILAEKVFTTEPQNLFSAVNYLINLSIQIDLEKILSE
jgi:hypothetical protein